MFKSLVFIGCYLFFTPPLPVCAQSVGSPATPQADSLLFLHKKNRLTKPWMIQGMTTGEYHPTINHPAARLIGLNTALSNRTNTICYDTSSRFFFKSDSLIYYPYKPFACSDGNLLIAGTYIDRANLNVNSGFLLKMDYSGNILWGKLYDSANQQALNFTAYYEITELADGSLILGGATNNFITQNDDLLLTRIDASGNIIWSKNYKSRIWTYGNGSADYFYIQDMKQDPYTGELYLCGPHWANGRAMIKVDITNGNIIWSNLYEYNGVTFDLALGFDIRPDEIRYFGRMYNYNTYISVIRINKQTGDTIAVKMFRINDTAGYRAELLTADQLTKRSNGNYLLGGMCYGYYQFQWNGTTPLYQASAIEIDSNLNFIRAHAYRSAIESNGYNTQLSLFTDGTGLLTYLKYIGSFDADVYYVQFYEGQILRRRKRSFTNEGYPYEYGALRTPGGGDLMTRMVGHPFPGLDRADVMTLHPSDTASTCLGLDDSLNFSQPVNYQTHSWRPDLVGYNVFSETPTKTFRSVNHIPYYLPGCSTVSYCDTISIEANPAVACPNTPVIITLHKNPECGTDVPLLYDSNGVQSVTKLNDSTYSFLFSGAWSGFIGTQVMGCTLMKDSVFVNVLSSPPILNLGSDTALCPGNTIVLNASNHFTSYLWQDGSNDSVYIVTQPGTYFVTVNSNCGGLQTDTVIVNSGPAVPLSAGPDRTICLNDTAHLSASGGFSNYRWSPNYRISSTTAQNVIVNPLVDTIYTLIAEKTPGCFGFDTVRIIVNQSPQINLGTDKSFCTGDSAVLNAGPGFAQYQWSNGSATQQITVYAVGNYSVIGTTNQGCRSMDTLRINNVYANPVVSLDPDTTLCTGTSRILDAGSGYAIYNWNTGSTAQTITISNTGTYSIVVTDNNNCRGTDTSFIKHILPLPAGFLGADTAICSYGNLQLKPIGSLNGYHWSTGSSTPAITIIQPGVYWLQATDRNGCTGVDTVLVYLKDCLFGFYMPTAFTPNNDGKNDVLKPILLGDVKEFHFWIYNRWGQAIFETNDLNKGWSGKINGVTQDGHVFVWLCRYRFKGEPVKLEKGTVVIIR